MYGCRHERDDDAYASGAENRRQNRDRLNRDVAVYENLRRLIREGSRSPFSGHACIPDYPYGLGHGNYSHGPPLNPYGRYYEHPGFPGPMDKLFHSPLYDNDFDSDDESPSPWYHASTPPYYGTSPSCTARRPRQSHSIRPRGPGPRNSQMDAFEHDYYRRMADPYYPCLNRRY